MTGQHRFNLPPYGVLFLIWLASNAGDRLWLALDQGVPAWDQSNHLSYSLLYGRALENPDFGNGDWWRQFWLLSPKYPPLTYLLAVPFQLWLGWGNDQALWTNGLYSAILIVCVYGLGKKLFTPSVGLWGATIMVLMPRLYHTRLQFLLDNPLLAFTILTFTCLTYWQDQKNIRQQWFWTGLLGLSLGLGLLTKQSILFYLFFPFSGIIFYLLWHRQWLRLGQLIISFFVSALVWFPWYRTNWLSLFSTAQNSNAIPASLEGDPPLHTWRAWLYYWHDLPLAVSWVWLLPPLVGLILLMLKRLPTQNLDLTWQEARPGLLWLGLYVGGTYFICSAIYNKDSRYILPYLPALALLLAYGLTRWRGRWLWVRQATLILACGVALTNLFPIPGTDNWSQILNPAVLFRPYLGPRVPNAEVFTTAIAAAPQQQINLGVIPNTASVNPNTLNYFGGLARGQGFGRELGSQPEIVAQDQANFNWLLTQTGENGFAQPAQLALAQNLPQNPAFKRLQIWDLAPSEQLSLWQRSPLPVEIFPQELAPTQLTLESINIAPQAPPGHPLAVTYVWSGSWQQLSQGILLITWKNVDRPSSQWLGDHAAGLGVLMPPRGAQRGLKIIERTALLPPAQLAPGTYELQVDYLDPSTQKTEPVAIPPTQIIITPQTAPAPAPPVDFVSQLRNLAPPLAQGLAGLEPIFREVGRLNIYDPTQDYLRQADLSLSYRLSQGVLNPIPLTYALVLARVLQQNPPQAIAALQSLVQLEPDNPYAHAYLAFVYLYDWQGHKGAQALAPALKLAPHQPEFQALAAIAALMQGNVWRAWQIAEPLLTR
jgi:4-amino-4-deoxy-L-arabinose transferase-like glycosyltransferase